MFRSIKTATLILAMATAIVPSIASAQTKSNSAGASQGGGSSDWDENRAAFAKKSSENNNRADSK